MSEKNVKKIYPCTRNWITHKDSNLAASYLAIECPFNFMWLQKNHQQHSQQKWIKFTYIFLHHIRAMFSHHLHVILYEHSILLLSTFQHGVDSNVRTSSTNTSTVMKQINKRSKKKNDHVVKRKKIQPTSNFEFLCGQDAVNAVYTTRVVPTFYPTEVRVGFRILKIIYCIIFNAYWSPSSLYQTFRHYLTCIWMLTAANPVGDLDQLFSSLVHALVELSCDLWVFENFGKDCSTTVLKTFIRSSCFKMFSHLTHLLSNDNFFSRVPAVYNEWSAGGLISNMNLPSKCK